VRDPQRPFQTYITNYYYYYYYYYYYCVLPLTDYKLSAIDAVRRPMLEKLRSNTAQSMPVSQLSNMSPYRHTALPTNSPNSPHPLPLRHCLNFTVNTFHFHFKDQLVNLCVGWQNIM